MLTPISTKIEEFKEKFPSYGTKVIEAGAEELESFISTALQQRDEEWRELVDNNQRPLIAFASINHPPRPEYVAEIKGYNQALNDIITKSKEI